jgi:hypothetical protein
VIRDTVPPTVARVFNVGGANVQVVFSKTVEAASATNLANYAFTNALPITGASLGADNLTLTLTTAPMVYGSNYGLVINGVRDRASIPNTIATNTLAVFLALACLTQDIGNPSAASVVGYAGANGLSVTTSGGVIGTAADQCGFEYQMFTGDFDLSVRLPGLSASDPWAKAGLMARQTLDASSRFAAALTTPSMSGSFFEWRNPANSPSTMAGVFPPNLPNAWLRLRRAATTFTGYASYDGQAWTLLGSASITMPAQVYVGLAASSHNSNLAATAQFRDLGNVTSAAVNTVPYP